MWISRSTFLEREEGSVSTLAGAKREYRCAVSSLPGNGQSLFIRPAATRIGSGYNCRVPGKESSLVETMYYIYVYIYIYIYSSFFRINRLVKENIRDGGRREDFDISKNDSSKKEKRKK